MEYITREEWGAIESGRRLSPFRVRPVGIVVHHTTGSSSAPAERVKNHDRYHVKTLGWKSIGYNFLIGSNGLASRCSYEGLELANDLYRLHRLW